MKKMGQQKERTRTHERDRKYKNSKIVSTRKKEISQLEKTLEEQKK